MLSQQQEKSKQKSAVPNIFLSAKRAHFLSHRTWTHIHVHADTNESQTTVSDEFYYIVTNKCTECNGFHEEPQCAAVCPVDCCIPDPDHEETEEVLLGKKAFMHDE